jgi:putative oxidoreductase
MGMANTGHMFKKLFVPSDDSELTHMALLVTRLCFGLTMLFNHGILKITHFKELAGTFQDPLRVGPEASLILVALAEVVGSILLTVGFFTRIAAAVLVIDMFVAFLMVDKTVMQGEGELAFLYLAGFVILAISGGGMFSVDAVAFGQSGRSRLQKGS